MTDPVRLHVVGWRHLTHSFAIVNQWQLLSLMKRDDVRLSFEHSKTGWKHSPGMFNREQTAAIASLGAPDWPIDVEYRIRFPFDLAPAADDRRVLVFCVTESGVFAGKAFAGDRHVTDVNDRGGMKLVTPSRWSRERLLENGVDDSRIEVVPHGVDVSTFRPDAALREQFRSRIGIDDFAFLNVSAMVGTKGIGMLLEAFGIVLESGAKATLVLKGNDALYKSKPSVQGLLQKLNEQRRNLVIDNLVYIGQPFDMQAMAGLYNAADAYVSPYMSEGFNMPVLEAAAAGLPLICTGGGSTDDFTTDMFRRSISAQRGLRENGGRILLPSLDHLVELMRGLMEDRDFARQARVAGPLHASSNYSWDSVAAQLMRAVRAA